MRKSLFLILGLIGIAMADTGFKNTLLITETDNSPKCTVGQIKVSTGTLTCNGQTATISTGGGGGSSGTPGGATTQVQYNSAGSFAGDADFTFDGTAVTATSQTVAGQLSAASVVFNEDSGLVAFTGYAHSVCSAPIFSLNVGTALTLGDATGACGTASSITLADDTTFSSFYSPGSALQTSGSDTLSYTPSGITGLAAIATLKGIKISSNTVLAGATFYQQGPISLGNNVNISSGVLLSGAAGSSGQVLTSGGSGAVPTWTTPAGGSGSTLAVTTGTSSGFSSIASSPTAVVNFNQSQFSASLTGSATGFVSISYSTNAITGSTTLTSTQTVVIANCASNCTQTLPTAVGVSGKTYSIKMINAAPTQVTVGTTSSQTIDGATTQILYIQYTNLEVISDGSNWHIL